MSQNIQFISKEEIRNLFNEYILPEKTKGNLFEIVKEDKHPARNLAGEPFCTRSQYVVYYDRNNKEIARVHQYLLRNGKLGASGKPDPKRIVVNGIIYGTKNNLKQWRTDIPFTYLK